MARHGGRGNAFPDATGALVDDERSIVDFIRLGLRTKASSCQTAPDGQAALR